MIVENAIWIFASALSLVVVAWLGGLMFGSRHSARFWLYVAVATGLFGLTLAPRCLCRGTDLVVGSVLGALVLGVVAYVLVCAAVLVIDRLRTHLRATFLTTTFEVSSGSQWVSLDR